jgi:hydrogenase maturation protease
VRRLRERGMQTGIEVSERLCEANDLLEAWQGRDAVVLVDAMRSGEAPGTIRRFDVSSEPLPARLRCSMSTHAFGLHDAIELGRALNRLPRRVIVLAGEGRHFEAGATPSGEVEAAGCAARMRSSPRGQGAGAELRGLAAGTPSPNHGVVAATSRMSSRRHATASKRRTLGSQSSYASRPGSRLRTTASAKPRGRGRT